jgi:uncharacterized protein (TIGR03083 family)
MSTDPTAPAETAGPVSNVGPFERACAETLDVFGSMTAEELDAPSACEGWTVRTVLAHVTQGVAALAGQLAIEPYGATDDFESAIDARARQLAERPADELLEILRTSVPIAVGFFASLSGPVAQAPVVMASAGTYPLGSMPDALTFDQTCHLRWDVLAPRGPVRRELPPVDEGRLSASLDWLVGGIPQMTTARFRALVTDPLTVEITGAGARTFQLTPGRSAVGVASGAA